MSLDTSHADVIDRFAGPFIAPHRVAIRPAMGKWANGAAGAVSCNEGSGPPAALSDRQTPSTGRVATSNFNKRSGQYQKRRLVFAARYVHLLRAADDRAAARPSPMSSKQRPRGLTIRFHLVSGGDKQ